MSPKNTRISSTATSASTQAWLPAEAMTPTKKSGTTALQTESGVVIVSQRRHASDALGMKITVSIEPGSASKRQAIRRLNEEIEGKASPADTYASRTAG